MIFTDFIDFLEFSWFWPFLTIFGVFWASGDGLMPGPGGGRKIDDFSRFFGIFWFLFLYFRFYCLLDFIYSIYIIIIIYYLFHCCLLLRIY